MSIDSWRWVDFPRSLTPEQAVQRRLADELVARWYAGTPTAVTWLNHHTAATHLADPEPLHRFDLVGIDGDLLRRLVDPSWPRTSGDVVLSVALPRLRGARIAVVGGEPATLEARAAAVTAATEGAGTVVVAADGFSGLPEPADAAARFARQGVDVVLVGLGAPQQDRWGAQLAEAVRRPMLIATCGGFLDQLLTIDYYPEWAYPLHLNWLVRLAREPRRLLRRYTTEALAGVRGAESLQRLVADLPGAVACAAALRTPPMPTPEPRREDAAPHASALPAALTVRR